MNIPAQSTKRQFITLNGLRGVAALFGVIFHNEANFGWHPENAYLAVEMFFVISGFVLSYVYGEKIDKGLSARSFMTARLVRLAPLYLLALVVSVVLVALDPPHSVHRLGAKVQVFYFVMSLFLLPSHVSQDPSLEVLRYNNPSWTLLMELIMNLIHVTLLRKVRTRVLAAVNGAAAVGIIVFCLRHHHLNAGWKFPSLFTIGFVRAAFSYTAGMLLFRLWRRRELAMRVPAPLCVAAVVGILLAPALSRHTALVTAFVIATAVFLLPGIVLLSANSQPSAYVGRLFSQLGIASYTVYILHFPAFHLFRLLAPDRVFLRPTAGYSMIVMLVALGLFLDKYYDEPVRNWLRCVLDRESVARGETVSVT